MALLIVSAGPSADFLIVQSEPLAGDALVVLAGSSVYDERIHHAIRAFKQGRAGTIILTNDGIRGGWSRQRQRNVAPIERARDALNEAGVRDPHIVLCASASGHLR